MSKGIAYKLTDPAYSNKLEGLNFERIRQKTCQFSNGHKKNFSYYFLIQQAKEIPL